MLHICHLFKMVNSRSANNKESCIDKLLETAAAKTKYLQMAFLF